MELLWRVSMPGCGLGGAKLGKIPSMKTRVAEYSQKSGWQKCQPNFMKIPKSGWQLHFFGWQIVFSLVMIKKMGDFSIAGSEALWAAASDLQAIFTVRYRTAFETHHNFICPVTFLLGGAALWMEEVCQYNRSIISIVLRAVYSSFQKKWMWWWWRCRGWWGE